MKYSKKLLQIYAEGARKAIYDRSSVLYDIWDREGIEKIIADPESISSPWYGQLMRAPQILAYIIQLDYWFRKYKISIV